MFAHTFATINNNVENKEYVLQHTKYGYRCISWYPHYIMTDWTKNKEQALVNGDNTINKYYNDRVKIY
jgi:hypothetical protein